MAAATARDGPGSRYFCAPAQSDQPRYCRSAITGSTGGGGGARSAAAGATGEHRPRPRCRLAAVGRLPAGGLIISSDSFFFAHSERLAALATHHAIPTIFGFREFVAAGGLMSYGADLADPHRWLGVYTGRILKGEKPAGLPVLQATKVELVINLTAAKTLGLTVPLPLIGRADEVIE